MTLTKLFMNLNTLRSDSQAFFFLHSVPSQFPKCHARCFYISANQSFYCFLFSGLPFFPPFDLPGALHTRCLLQIHFINLSLRAFLHIYFNHRAAVIFYYKSLNCTWTCSCICFPPDFIVTFSSHFTSRLHFNLLYCNIGSVIIIYLLFF